MRTLHTCTHCIHTYHAHGSGAGLASSRTDFSKAHTIVGPNRIVARLSPPLRVLRRLPQRQRPLQVAPPPPGPPPPPPQAHTTGLRRSGRTRRRVTPASTQYATSSSSSSGVDDGRCDDGEFALDLAEVAEEAAVVYSGSTQGGTTGEAAVE